MVSKIKIEINPYCFHLIYKTARYPTLDILQLSHGDHQSGAHSEAHSKTQNSKEKLPSPHKMLDINMEKYFKFKHSCVTRRKQE